MGDPAGADFAGCTGPRCAVTALRFETIALDLLPDEVGRGIPGNKRPAYFTGPVAAEQCLFGSGKKLHVFGLGLTRRAGRTAEDAGCFHGRNKPTFVGGIFGYQGLVALGSGRFGERQLKRGSRGGSSHTAGNKYTGKARAIRSGLQPENGQAFFYCCLFPFEWMGHKPQVPAVPVKRSGRFTAGTG